VDGRSGRTHVTLRFDGSPSDAFARRHLAAGGLSRGDIRLGLSMPVLQVSSLHCSENRSLSMWNHYHAANAGRRDHFHAAWVRVARMAYSMTWSARASSDGGIVRPRALAVLRLMTNSNLVGCSTGKSAGFAPRSTLAT
jgi:hypothetical protein